MKVRKFTEVQINVTYDHEILIFGQGFGETHGFPYGM
jgi:hypothetical protein